MKNEDGLDGPKIQQQQQRRRQEREVKEERKEKGVEREKQNAVKHVNKL